MRGRHTGWWGTLLVVLGGGLQLGCYHVDLHAPPSTLSPEQRFALFSELRPTKQGYLSISMDQGETWTLSSTSILLGRGVEIVHADDLLPVVAADSPAARAARRSASARRRGFVAATVELASILAGAWCISEWFDDATWPAGRTGLGLILIGAPISLLATRHFERVELRERRIAFQEYPRSLADTLRVCADKFAIVPCETIPAKPPQPDAPDGHVVPSSTFPIAFGGSR